jgi:uncharacterized protein DUF5666
MTIHHSFGWKTTRKIAWGAPIFLAVAAAACGNSPQSMLGVSPSAVSSIAATSDADAGGTFGLLKEGKDKDKGKDNRGGGPGKGDKPAPEPAPVPPPVEAPTPAPGTPTDGTTPGVTPAPGTTPEPDDDANEDGPRGGQIEGTASEVTGTCPALTIVVNGHTVKTDATTDFQRAACEQIAIGRRLHISGRMHEGSFVAGYVRMQGRKPGDDEDGDDDVTPPPTGTTPPPSGTTPVTGTTPTV